MVWYLQVEWSHDFCDKPVEIWSEVGGDGGDGYESRKIEVFRDGRLEYADEHLESGATFLRRHPSGRWRKSLPRTSSGLM